MKQKTKIILPGFGAEPFFVIDKDGAIIRINEAARKVTGLSASAVSRSDFKDLFTTPVKAGKMIKEVMQKGIVSDFTLSFNNRKVKKGTEVVFNAFSNAASPGGSQQVIAIAVTAKGQIEDELEQNLLTSIVNSSDDAIISKSLDGIITSWNKAARRILGYSPAEIIGKHITKLIPPHLHKEETEIIKKIRKGEMIEHYETERVKKNGKIIEVSLTISPIKNSKGKIIGASKILRDISKQKKDAEALRTFKEQETVLNRINDAVVSVDNDWRYTFLNDAAMSTHPQGKEKTLGRVIWDVHPEMQGTIFWDKYHEAMETRKVVEIESYYQPMDTWFFVKVYPSADGLTIFYKNITESKKAEQKISQTLREVTDYKLALDESSIVAITDQKGVIKHANDNFCKISKYSREELIGQDHRIINSGYHPKEFIRNLWATIANGKIWKGELKNRAKDGTIYWVDTTIVPFLNEDKKPYQYLAIRSDITSRKEAEENLAQSLKEISDYKYAIDESSIVAITDQKGIIKHANDNFCKISKYSREELIGQDHRIINSGYHPKEFIRNLWVTIANGKIWKGELKNRAKDGTIYWVDTTIVPFLNEDKKPYQYLAIRSDITSRKEAEENLAQSLKEISDYKYALDESSIVAITDQKGIIRHANHNFCKISKYGLEELIGQDHRIINSGYHPKEFIRNLWVTIANGKIWRGELKNRAKDGTIYWVDTTIIPFLNNEGKPYQYVAIRADITQRKQAEQEVLVLNEELEKRVKERTEEIESFSYSVSHDLRAPLRAVNGYARILEEDYNDLFDTEGKRLLGEVQQNAKKMGVLIDDLLAFSRLGRKEIERSEINMTKLAEFAIKEINQTTVHNALIKLNALHPVKADYALIQNVMINLISNAVKYSQKKENPVIEISSKKGPKDITYSIKDNGVGFDMQYANKLFGVFQRLHTPDEFPGTGVGLAIVSRIITKHGGKIWAEGKVDKGATFYFTLPVN